MQPNYQLPTGQVKPPKISGQQYVQIPNFDAGQQQLYQGGINAANQGGGFQSTIDFLQKLAGGDESSFSQLEAPAYRAYEKNIGSLANRFAGYGALDSSSFRNAAQEQASTMGENLASQRMGIQDQATQRLLQLFQGLLQQKPTSSGYLPEGGTDYGSLIGQLIGQSLPQLLAMLGGGVAGPAGAVGGSIVGNAIGGMPGTGLGGR